MGLGYIERETHLPPESKKQKLLQQSIFNTQNVECQDHIPFYVFILDPDMTGFLFLWYCSPYKKVLNGKNQPNNNNSSKSNPLMS